MRTFMRRLFHRVAPATKANLTFKSGEIVKILSHEIKAARGDHERLSKLNNQLNNQLNSQLNSQLSEKLDALSERLDALEESQKITMERIAGDANAEMRAYLIGEHQWMEKKLAEITRRLDALDK